ncbi:BAG family molecular chaperone regulator 8, chloroplastic [Lycium barbarum]|uniref:BAG family molecular chaperone regulator 8, chloroplastic n=1 Tax=Lycium barbarum TaxID=112863 RepID=UPI00293EF6AC|nr:BAG family molecular chaperone regulator 8, chloroplastic [Lycium barbarum]
MASHHHYHHPCPTAAASTTICYCHSCHPTPTPYPQHPHPPPPNPHSTPPYTHYPAPPPHTPHFYASHPTPPPTYNPHTQCQCEPTHHFQESNHHYFQESNKLPDQQTDRIVTSLLRRIAALESSLSVRRSSSSSSRQTLRDAAARTIQAHFRAFLARRSRTLRQLKQLASIKTTLNILKSSVSAKTHFHTHTVSRRAMDLLVKLGSIQGDDQLIRDGKRSISKELTRFMKAINGVTVISRRIVKNVRNDNKARAFSSDPEMEIGTKNRNEAIDKFVASVNESEEEEEEEEHQKPRFSEVRKSGVLRGRDEGGLKPKHKKSVSFAENVNRQESYDAELELMRNLSKRVEKIGILSKDDAEVDEEEDGGGSSGSSDDEIMDPDCISRKDNGPYERRNVRDENENANENETESFLFSAPLPVKMEGRAADYISRKKGVKIVDN